MGAPARSVPLAAVNPEDGTTPRPLRESCQASPAPPNKMARPAPRAIKRQGARRAICCECPHPVPVSARSVAS